MEASYGAEYVRLYREHWWWRARQTILLDSLRSLRPRSGSAILDVGCGDALSFPTLAEFGEVRGIEVDDSLLDPAGPFRERISTRPLGDPLYDDPSWRFDLITALDVIEHIDDDRAAVSSMAAMLRPRGLLVVTVPAFELLWDQHDEINHHRRRYTAGRLRHALQGHGMALLQVRYLFPALFLPKLLVRLANANRSQKVAQHGIPAPAINAALKRFCVIEDRLLRRVPVPLGTSVLGVARNVIKTGMLHTAAIVSALAELLAERTDLIPLVIDPVMVSKGGTALLDRDSIRVMIDQLLPQAYLLTPNIPEAERLLGRAIRSETEMEQAARDLHALGPANVLLKGGHLTGRQSIDILFDGYESREYAAERVFTSNTHGTGCTYASAIASYLAQGEPLRNAVEKAKEFISAAIRLAHPLGKGHSPVNHFAAAQHQDR